MWERRRLLACALCLSCFVSAALAHDEHEHGGDSHGGMNMPSSSVAATPTGTADPEEPSIYFYYSDHKAWLYAHIVTMVVSWVFVMPIATMLSIAGSRYHLPVQVAFLATNGLGIVFSTIYNSMTPDLYPNNAHHKLGWALVWILCAQAALGVLGKVVRHSKSTSSWGKEERSGFLPVAQDSPIEGPYRQSQDSGMAASMEHDSRADSEELEEREWVKARHESEVQRWFHVESMEGFLSRRAPFVFNDRVAGICGFLYSLIARFLIPLGFAQLSLGIVTGSGIFTGSGVFNGLAHFIKGGIFFLYGIVTLGRFLGSCADLGWAWNIKPASPKGSKWAPTAEMTESGLIFTYGFINIWMEHLAGWGSAWTHSDLQHVSIAFMFLGGGLCGILVESRRVRDLLSRSIATTVATPTITTPYMTAVPEEAKQPSTYSFSFNPLPATVIFLLGILLSSHHQHSALSTKIHTQWGLLLSGGALCRLLTYFLFFRSPPTSYYPSRPPSELIGSFCLMSGGLIFMASSRDPVNYMESIGVDGMFTLVVTVGFVLLIMSWVITVLSIKGLAIRREQRELYGVDEVVPM